MSKTHKVLARREILKGWAVAHGRLLSKTDRFVVARNTQLTTPTQNSGLFLQSIGKWIFVLDSEGFKVAGAIQIDYNTIVSKGNGSLRGSESS